MNYRHAYHAGNFADCMKHALLLALLRALLVKPGAIFVLDTHAGAGHYDLESSAARRTGEAAAGIARLLDDPPDALRDYVASVCRIGLYPGSPELIRSVLRPNDRLTCCELQDEEAAALRRLLRGDPRVSVHRRDGWQALKALLPPKLKRGLVLIDPPFEDAREFEHLAAGIALARTRFPTGVVAGWYPIKHLASVHALLSRVNAPDALACELSLRTPLDPSRLNGCGLLIVNPPYQFAATARRVLEALLDRLGNREPGEAIQVHQLAQG